VEGAAAGCGFPSTVHRRKRDSRRGAAVDAWELRSEAATERVCEVPDFHDSELRTGVSSGSTGGVWTVDRGARSGFDLGFDLGNESGADGVLFAAAADGEDTQTSEDDGGGGEQNLGDGEARAGFVGRRQGGEHDGEGGGGEADDA
jgi:hypothetical protein